MGNSVGSSWLKHGPLRNAIPPATQRAMRRTIVHHAVSTDMTELEVVEMAMMLGVYLPGSSVD